MQWSKEDKAVGYGIVACDGRQQEIMAWALRESAVDNHLQHLAEGVKFAQMKDGD
mgnify:FL=1